MNIKSCLLILYILLWGLSVSSQNTTIIVDSLLNLVSNTNDDNVKTDFYLQISEKFTKTYQLDSARIYAERAFDLAMNSNEDSIKFNLFIQLYQIEIISVNFIQADSLLDVALQYAKLDSQKAKYYNNKVGTLHRFGKTEGQMEYLKKARLHIGDDTLSRNMMTYYSSLSNYHIMKHNYFLALNLNLEASKLAKKYDPKYLIVLEQNLTLIYEILQDYDNAIEKLLEINARLDSLNDYKGILFGYFGLSSVSLNKKDYAAAKKYCQEAIQLRKDYGVSTAFGFIYYILGEVAIEESKLDSALYYFQKGIDISLEQNEKKVAGDCYWGLGQVYYLNKDYTKAKKYITLYNNLIDFIDTRVNTILADIYQSEGKLQKAYQLLQQNNKLRIEQDSAGSTNKMVSKLLSLNFEQAQAQDALKQKIQAQELEIQKKNNNYLTLGILGSVCLFLGTLFFLYRLRLKQQTIASQKAEIEEKNQGLEELNTLKDKTFAVLAHDLRSPIGGLNQVLEMTSKSELSRAEFLEMVDDLKKNTSAVYDNLNNILEWANLQLHGNVSKATILDLQEEVDKVKSFLSNLIQQKRLHFYNQIPPNTKVSINKNHLNIVLRNLVSNAIKYTEEHGNITISNEINEDKVIVRVKDTGIGVTEEEVTRIFDIGTSTWGTAGEKGIGLGLNLCKEIIEKYNGSIGVKNNKDVGSEFYFSLPTQLN